MAMSYTTLTGGKGAAGSIMNWVSYSRLDVGTVVDEAQSLLYTMLRVREMRTEWTFGLLAGAAHIALPDRFLDPIGRLFDLTNVTDYGHKIESDIMKDRAYDSSPNGALGANALSFTINSSQVTVNKPAHGLNQDSTFFISGATAAAGITANGAFPVVSITDADNFVIDVDTQASATITGGGSAMTYTANNLIAATPSRWSVWDEQLKFDVALVDPITFKLLYYRSKPLLSASNPTNFLTNRYPLLMRKACQAASADYMKDDTEYQKQVTALGGLIQTVNAQDDMIYRGAEFGTDTP